MRTTLYITLALLVFVSCAKKSGQTVSVDTETQTVKDLKNAADGEATASAKYAAYARQAAKEKRAAIATLFEATSRAELVHLHHHLHALKNICDSDYRPSVKSFEVKTTRYNLQAAIKGEQEEFTSMYPAYFADARKDYEDEAERSFKWAFLAERKHAQLYQEALTNMDSPQKLSTTYYVCPACGNVYAGIPAEKCEICGLTSDKFIQFKAKK